LQGSFERFVDLGGERGFGMTIPKPSVQQAVDHGPDGSDQTSRTASVAGTDAAFGTTVQRLLDLAEDGLPAMFRGDQGSYAFTRRGRRLPSGQWQTRLDGTSIRYGAITALGASSLPEERQRNLFGGESVHEFCARLLGAISASSELGEVALVSWLAGEIGHADAARALELLTVRVAASTPAPVVETAWALTAAVALSGLAPTGELAGMVATRLLAARGGDGVLFPHNITPTSQPWYRQPVGCFADQVYPIQALARYHRTFDDRAALGAAQSCADRICDLQGDAGQWWWHYDWSQGDVIEGYPVYSVHQHAMAPMALLDLAECGGSRHDEAIRLGVGWLTDRPETPEPLVFDELGVVWRKVARREPKPKLTRFLRGAARAVSSGSKLRVLDAVARPTTIDFECRPYELGWLLYAWRHQIGSAIDARASQ
jgi:hypothetical protein